MPSRGSIKSFLAFSKFHSLEKEGRLNSCPENPSGLEMFWFCDGLIHRAPAHVSAVALPAGTQQRVTGCAL